MEKFTDEVGWSDYYKDPLTIEEFLEVVKKANHYLEKSEITLVGFFPSKPLLDKKEEHLRRAIPYLEFDHKSLWKSAMRNGPYAIEESKHLMGAYGDILLGIAGVISLIPIFGKPVSALLLSKGLVGAKRVSGIIPQINETLSEDDEVILTKANLMELWNEVNKLDRAMQRIDQLKRQSPLVKETFLALTAEWRQQTKQFKRPTHVVP